MTQIARLQRLDHLRREFGCDSLRTLERSQVPLAKTHATHIDEQVLIHDDATYSSVRLLGTKVRHAHTSLKNFMHKAVDILNGVVELYDVLCSANPIIRAALCKPLSRHTLEGVGHGGRRQDVELVSIAEARLGRIPLQPYICIRYRVPVIPSSLIDCRKTQFIWTTNMERQQKYE